MLTCVSLRDTVSRQLDAWWYIKTEAKKKRQTKSEVQMSQ